MQLKGGCHCGNIGFTLDWPGEPDQIPARSCGCSFCVKHGGVWTSHPGAVLVATFKAASHVSRYSFGTRTADFHVCAVCGAVPLVSCELDHRVYAVVNVNTLENLDPARLQTAAADFEGEALGDRLARRQRNWIGDVRFIDAGEP